MHSLPESVVLNSNHKIDSPEGFVDFLGVNKITKNSYVHLVFSNGSELKCSENHPIITLEGPIKAKNLKKTTEVTTKTGGCFVVSKKIIRKPIELYDIVNSGTLHQYYSNGIVSHNCDFLGSTHTLISGSKLKQLNWEKPISVEDKDESGQLDIYEQPKPEHTYVTVCDVSRGQGLDYQAFSVIDVTAIPYIQVAKYRNNRLSPMTYPNLIERTSRKYNDAYVLVEINDIGQQVVDILHYDLSYENLLKMTNKGSSGQNVASGYGRQVLFGVRTTVSVKRIGCSNLKSLIEGNKLVLKDFDTISELSTFVSQRESYSAEDGCNDDLAMTLVLFGWLINQRVFKESVGTDIRTVLEREQYESMQADYLPAPIVANGMENYMFQDDNGTVWTE